MANYTAHLFLPDMYLKADGDTPEECLGKLQVEVKYKRKCWYLPEIKYRPSDLTIYFNTSGPIASGIIIKN